MERQVRHLSKTFGSGQHRKEVLRDTVRLRSGEFFRWWEVQAQGRTICA